MGKRGPKPKSRVVTEEQAKYGRTPPGVAPGWTGGAGGQAPFVATDAQRRIVENLISCDFTQDTIAIYLRIPEATLQRHFKHELANGKRIVHSEIATGIVQSAREGDKTMKIYYSKAQMGWRERTTVGIDDGTGKVIDPSKLFQVNITG